jgi:Arc/MetJ-type ribon-helix-helix transcriptional regulator
VALTVRLDPKTERALNALARRRGLSRSDVVREALALYEASGGERSDGSRPADAWLDVIGVVDLGVRDPARTTGEQVAALLADKARARRSR